MVSTVEELNLLYPNWGDDDFTWTAFGGCTQDDLNGLKNEWFATNAKRRGKVQDIWNRHPLRQQAPPQEVSFGVEFEYREQLLFGRLSVDKNLSGNGLLDEIGRLLYAMHSLPNNFFTHHKLRLADGEGIASASLIVPGSTLYLHIPGKLTKVCGSKWVRGNLRELGMESTKSISDLREFLGLLGVSENVHSSVIHESIASELRELGLDTFTAYTQRDKYSALRSEAPEYALHRKALTKSLHLVNKFSNLESLVDNFTALLLDKVGFNEGMLAVAPKLGLKIEYGSRESTVDAIADFCIVDVLSNVIFVVTEEKPKDVDSLPQMVAESIAAYCTNEALRESFHEAKHRRVDSNNQPIPPRIVGLRICSTRFNFYVTEISEAITTALSSGMVCSTKNNLYHFTCGRSLDTADLNFLVHEDRLVILEVLCKLQLHFTELEVKAGRAHSGSISA